MSERSYERDWVSPILATISTLLYYLVFGLFMLCKWLTGELISKLLNPLFDDVFERNDGLVVLASSGIWLLVGWTSVPLLLDAPTQPSEVWAVLWPVSLIALAWGLAIGGWLVSSWWTAVESQTSASDFIEATGLPRSFYEDQKRSDDDDDDDWKGLILGVEATETTR